MTVWIVSGPPCSGKSTWVAEQAVPNRDLIIDYDAMGAAAGFTDREYDGPVKKALQVARKALIDYALKTPGLQADRDVYIIQTRVSDAQRVHYTNNGCSFWTCDPGEQVCLDRAEAERPEHIRQVILDWYNPPETKPRPSGMAQGYMFDDEGRRYRPGVSRGSFKPKGSRLF